MHKVSYGCGIRQINRTLVPGGIEFKPFYEGHSVRCCNQNGTWCETPKPCKTEKTFDEAKDICNNYTNSTNPQEVFRLCREDEEQHNLCCRLGCNMDRLQTWIADD